MSTSPLTTTPVLIIGGGIVGLSASLFLTSHSIPCILLERHPTTSIHPRARSINARTMELYSNLGIASRVQEAGASMKATMGMYHTHSSLREVIEPRPRSEKPRKFPFASIAEGISGVSGAFVTQDMLEPVLLDVARERGADIRFNTECLSVSQTASNVTATIKDRETGTVSKIQASYCIAADGANSPIRQALNIQTTGRGTMGHLLNILFHADLSSLVKGREFSLCYVEREEVTGLFTSINNSDRWVFHLSYVPSEGESAADFPPERCKELLRIALGFPDLDIEIKSTLPWTPAINIAEHMQDNRIFLAGDAAHQMPPWAGQGANSGIADVSNLSWKIAAVLKNQAHPDLLQTYEIERLPVGKAAAEVSADAADQRGIICTKKSVSMMWGLARRARLLSGHGYHYSSPAICEEDTSPFGGATWRPWTIPSLILGIDGSPGSRAPHLWLQREGERVSTLALFATQFTLLAGAEGGAWIEAVEERSDDKGGPGAFILGIDIAAFTIGPHASLVAAANQFEAAAGISPQGAILVRPDGFVVWRSRRASAEPEAEIERAMRRALCLPTHEDEGDGDGNEK